MSIAVPDDRYVEMNEVIELHLKGTNPTQIAKSMNLKRTEVLNYIAEWKTIAQNDPNIQARARETLYGVDKHMDMLINEFWDVASNTMDDKVKIAALRHAADIDIKRQEIMQKAGMYDDAALGDEVAKTQEQIEQIQQLLLSVIKDHPETKAFILQGLSRIFKKAVPDPVEQPIVGEVT